MQMIHFEVDYHRTPHKFQLPTKMVDGQMDTLDVLVIRPYISH